LSQPSPEPPASTSLLRRPSTGTLSYGLLFVAAVLLYAFTIAVAPDRPGAATALGYYAGLDPSHYLAEARALAAGHLPSSDEYLYGLGYPVLAAPLARLGLSDPFPPVNALLFALTVVLAARIGTTLRNLRFGLAVGLVVLFGGQLYQVFTSPWSNIVTMAACLVCLDVACRHSRSGRPLGVRSGLLLGVAVALTFAARYVDAIFPAAIAMVPLLRARGRRIVALVVAAAVCAVVGALVLWSHARVFGSPLDTPYSRHLAAGTADQSFSSYEVSRIPSRLWHTLVVGDRIGTLSGQSLLRFCPALALAPVGLVVLLRRYRRDPVGRALLVGVVVSLVASLFYLSFRGNGLILGGLRYYAIWFPLWLLLAVLGAERLLAAVVGRDGSGWSAAQVPGSRTDDSSPDGPGTDASGTDGSSTATHSTWAVIGNRSNARSDASR
jgi:hypothetical protein